MVNKFWTNIGHFILKLIKLIAWIIIHVLYFALELAKLFLLLFGLVARIVLAFVRVGTP